MAQADHQFGLSLLQPADFAVQPSAEECTVFLEAAMVPLAAVPACIDGSGSSSD